MWLNRQGFVAFTTSSFKFKSGAETFINTQYFHLSQALDWSVHKKAKAPRLGSESSCFFKLEKLKSSGRSCSTVGIVGLLSCFDLWSSFDNKVFRVVLVIIQSVYVSMKVIGGGLIELHLNA